MRTAAIKGGEMVKRISAARLGFIIVAVAGLAGSP